MKFIVVIIVALIEVAVGNFSLLQKSHIVTPVFYDLFCLDPHNNLKEYTNHNVVGHFEVVCVTVIYDH